MTSSASLTIVGFTDSLIQEATTLPSASESRAVPLRIVCWSMRITMNRLTHPATATSGKPITSSAPRGFCRNYWDTGLCPFGLDCRHKHELPPPPKTANGQSQAAAASAVQPEALGAFPDLTSIIPDSSDLLLKPTKFLPPSKVQAILREASEPGKRINTPVLAENLLLALNASNKLNALWVSEMGLSQCKL